VSEDNDLYQFKYAYPAAAGGIPALAAHLDAARDKAKATLIAESNDDRAQAKANDYPYRPHSFGEEWKVVADLPGFLSLSGEFYTFSGGAHGMSGLESLVWDKTAGKALDGVALFASSDALEAALGPKFCAALNKERAKRRQQAVPQGSTDEFDRCVKVSEGTVLVGSSNARTFDRLTIYLGPYVAGPYAEGAYELDFPVDAAVLAAVKPEYRAAFSAKA